MAVVNTLIQLSIFILMNGSVTYILTPCLTAFLFRSYFASGVLRFNG